LGEHVIYGVLLAMHNIALVGCAAAPFYNRNLVLTRGQYGPKLYYELDKVVEDTLQGNAPYCMVFIAVLVLTGIGIPINHLAFHGAFKQLHTIAWIAVALKLAFVFGMAVIMGIIFLKINPRLRVLFAGFKAGETANPVAETEFFALRTRRKQLCETCLKFAVGVLVFSAFIGFAS
jgi:hypothetical protein